MCAKNLEMATGDGSGNGVSSSFDAVGDQIVAGGMKNGAPCDNAEELRLRNELQVELPIEEDLSRWLGLFDAPLD